MKKFMTLIALILALTLTLASCGFLNPTPDDSGDDGEIGDGGSKNDNNEGDGETDDDNQGGADTEHTHAFGEWVTTTEPTCTEQGEKERVCGCGEREVESIDMTPHAFGEWVTTTEPTCNTQGEKERVCGCGEKEVETIERTEHNIVDGICDICNMKFSVGLAFISNGDGTCYVNGMGDCQDTELVIPPVSPAGDEVTSIANEAFRRNLTLTKITIPASVVTVGDLAFQYCYGVAEIIFEAGSKLSSIGRMSFYYCENLTGVVIPESVAFIGEAAFGACMAITEIAVPETNTAYKTVDGNLYNYEETSLIQYAIGKADKSFTVPASVISIGYEAFRYAKNLESLLFAEGCKLASIGESAFDCCIALVDISIPDSVSSIGISAFSNCELLKTITIPENVTVIETGVFGNCKALTEITIPSGIISIGSSAFYRCEKLKTVTVTEIGRLESIGERAFYECLRLESIFLPVSIKSIGNDAFAYCHSLSNVYYSGSEEEWSEITVGKSNDALTGSNIQYNKCPEYPLELLDGSGSVSISDFIGKKVVVNFWGTWCGPCKQELPDFDKIASEFSDEVVILAVHSVAYVDNADDYVNSNFPDSKIVFVKDTPLNDVTDLYFSMLGGTAYYPHTVILDELGSIIYMQDGTMSYDKLKEHLGLNTVKYSEGLLFVSNGDGTCYVKGLGDCIDTDIVVPPTSPENDKVTAIGAYSLRGTKITSVVLPDGITKIDDYAFYKCFYLESINIPSGVTYIGEGAFQQCTSLKGIDIPEGVTIIGKYAFDFCKLFTSVDIPSSVTEIGYYAFARCEAMSSISVADGNTAYKDIDGNLYTYDGKTLMQYAIAKTDTEFIIPEGVVTLAGNSFGWCESLQSVTIPGSVTGLHYAVFIGCSSLTSVTFGEGIKLASIGDSAFYACDMLADVYYAGTEAEWKSINILPANDCLKNATIHFESGKE